MGRPFEIISPIDDVTLPGGVYLSEEEALGRLARAETAQREFRKVSIEERVRLCLSFLEVFEQTKEESAREVSVAMGKPLAQSLGEIRGMRDRTEALCRSAVVTLSDKILEEKPGLHRRIRREPLGVVLDIAAWNYPYVVAINVVVPALLAGNAVLIKHAPQTACVARQMEKAFLAAGAPEGLVSDFMVDHETAHAILKTRRIAHVGFTGSVRGGAEVYARVAQTGFARCGLELGGKDAALLLDDADVDAAAIGLADGAFYNAGQSCCAVERIYVPRPKFAAFVDAFLAETYKLHLGHPLASETTLGPVVTAQAALRISEQVTAALAQGARQVSEDARFDRSGLGACYLPPRVLIDVNHSMALMKEETFGPVIGIQAYDSLEEGVRLVNDSPYGLTASLWTRDQERALSIGEELQVGTVYQNRCDAVDADLPWIGVKDSGLGFTLSQEGILSLTRPKSYNLKA